MFQFMERRRARQDEERLHRTRLELELRSRLPLDEDDLIRISEVRCGIPGCPDIETVFLLMRPGRRTEAAKAPVPMACLGAGDLDEVAARFRHLHADLAEAIP